MKLVRMPGFFKVNNMNNLFSMEFLTFILCVLPVIARSISISPNGNSPKVKMIGGMMVDVQKGFVPMTSKIETTTKSNYEKSRNITNGINSTKLALNERYRRLIPYMTFYYANDLARPTTDSTRNVEVEKAQIIEAKDFEHSIQRQPKKIFYSSQRNIPRFQGNRLTQYNIASANPTKIFYKDGVPYYQSTSPNVNPFLSDVSFNSGYDNRRFIPKQIVKSPGNTFVPLTRKPILNLYNEETPNIRYYIPEKEQAPKYKLVPYEQTPPVKVAPPKENIYEVRKPVIVSTVLVPKELHVKPRPIRPHLIYDTQHVRKQPSIISESYYEKQRPLPAAVEPVIESGFRPIVTPAEYTTESHIYSSTQPETPELPDREIEKRPLHITEPVPEEPIPDAKPNYYQYLVEQPQYHPTKQTTSNTVTLASLLNSLQVNKSIPKPITKENVASSIRTLLQVLNVLKSVEHPSEAEGPVLSTPKPFIAPKVIVELNKLSNTVETHNPDLSGPELNEEHYLAEVNTPSQHLDDHSSSGVTSQQFPLRVTSDDEGGTPGRPGIDYPVLTVIPPTSFDCKTQRYKGFFADTETRCQVWHYCDLNGGQASFLCPNGTIFSQAGLTCDWWFNVRCSSTTQLYVLNESLYKYILPHSPKFPEDYSGPLVDKYLTLKFKEMEEEFNKKKKSKQDSDSLEKDDTEEDEDEDSVEETNEEHSIKSQRNTVSEASVIVETPGDSGKVERLNDD